MHTICLVEDEKSLQELLKTYLEKEGYKVSTFSKGQDVLDEIEKETSYDLYVLDIMLEDEITGYDIIKKIKEKNEEIPVIFSSARDENIDKIMGLELGSDDYLAKPYSPKELVLRVKNILKRVYSKDFHKIRYNEYEINTEERTVSLNNKNIIPHIFYHNF